MAKNTFRVSYGSKLVVEYLLGTTQTEISPEELPEIEKAVREMVRIDRSSAYFAATRDVLKINLANRFGEGVRYIHYKGAKGRKWKVALFLNYSIDPVLAQTKLREHPEILEACLTIGTAARVIVPASLKNRKEVTERLTRAVEEMGGVVTHFDRAQLEPLLREKKLVEMCREKRVSLSGTKVARITAIIEEE